MCNAPVAHFAFLALPPAKRSGMGVRRAMLVGRVTLAAVSLRLVPVV